MMMYWQLGCTACIWPSPPEKGEAETPEGVMTALGTQPAPALDPATMPAPPTETGHTDPMTGLTIDMIAQIPEAVRMETITAKESSRATGGKDPPEIGTETAAETSPGIGTTTSVVGTIPETGTPEMGSTRGTRQETDTGIAAMTRARTDTTAGLPHSNVTHAAVADDLWMLRSPTTSIFTRDPGSKHQPPWPPFPDTESKINKY